LQRRRFYSRPQKLVQTIPRHDVGLAAENARGLLLHIADYVQAAQDAMDDEARQKLLVLVPALMRCVGANDPPDTKSARRVLLAERSPSRLVPLVLEAVGWRQDAEAMRASGGSFARLGDALREAIITIIEEAIGLARQSAPFTDPWDVLEAGERFKAAMSEGVSSRLPQPIGDPPPPALG
jgi:hypothetical protein